MVERTQALGLDGGGEKTLISKLVYWWTYSG